MRCIIVLFSSLLLLSSCGITPQDIQQANQILNQLQSSNVTQSCGNCAINVSQQDNLMAANYTGSVLPNPQLTPGAINPDVNQSNIQSTICVAGYTSGIRPPTSYTNNLKIQQIAQYGYADTNPADFEEDHLIALEIGGNPTDPHNLWPEPWNGTYNAHVKDRFENYLHAQVCSGAMNLSEAQREISSKWIQYYVQAGSP